MIKQNSSLHFKNNDEPIELKGTKFIILSKEVIKGNTADANIKFIITDSKGIETIPIKLDENKSNCILEMEFKNNAEVFIQQNIMVKQETEFILECIIS